MRRQADRDAKAMALDAIRKFDRAGALLQQRADNPWPGAIAHAVTAHPVLDAIRGRSFSVWIGRGR